jgi:hypothetical protein
VVRYDRTIPPGGVGQVTLQVNTTGYRGKISKSARVTTNDPRQRKSKIYLSMNVRAHIIVEPGPKIMLRGFVGDDIRRTVQIRAADDRPLEITKIQTNLQSVIDYQLTPKDDGKKYNLEVVSTVTEQKTASGFLTLQTNHPKKKVLKLSVHLRVKPEIQAWPNRIVFSEQVKPESKRKASKRVLTIMNNRGTSFRIQELNYNKNYFQVRSLAKNDSPANRYQFEVVPLLNRLPAGKLEFQDILTIQTDNAQSGELRIPLAIRLKK